MDLLWVGWYIVFFSGYILGFVLVLVAIHLAIIRKPRQSKNIAAASILVLISGVTISLNHKFVLSGNPDYMKKQHQARYRKENIKEAENVDFPVYTSRLDLEYTADIAARHNPVYVLYNVKEQPYTLTMYQYKKGTQPYTLRILSNGSCENEPICQYIDDSTFGKVYAVNQGSEYAGRMFFTTNSETSLFIEYKEKTSISDVINLINSLREISPKDLQFDLL